MSDSDINVRYRPAPLPDWKVRPETWLTPSEDYPDTPAANVSVPVTVGGSSRRTTTSPLAATTDYDVSLFTSDHQGEAPGYPVTYSAPSGATTEHSLSEHLVSLGAHETRVRRSRKGRTTFDVLSFGRSPAPVTDGATGLGATDAIALARLADSLLAATDGVRVVSPAGHVTYGRDDVSGSGAPWLLGSTVTAWAALIRDDRAARDTFGVCDHHADLFSALGVPDVSDRPLVMRRDRNVTGHVPVRHRPVVRSATYGDSLTRRSGSGETRLTWPARRRLRISLRLSERSEFSRFVAGTTDGRETSQSVVTYVTPDGALVSAHSDSDLVWHGLSCVVRPVTVAARKGRRTRSTSTVARRGRPSVRPSVTVPEPSEDGCWHVTTGRGSLTVRPAGASGRHSVSLVTPTGTERWQSRTVAAAIVRAS